MARFFTSPVGELLSSRQQADGYSAVPFIKANVSDPDFVILDVRTQGEFSEGHIENAVNIDFYSEGFRDELNTLDKKNTYLIYCRTGNRSGKAIEVMKDLEFETIYHMVKGITGWVEYGLVVVR